MMSQAIPQLAGHRILVIGDLILDEYLIGQATRMSREAPIPVLEFETRRLIPGGAANPAANVVALNSQALQIGVIGSDSAGTNLRQVLQAKGIDTQGLIIDAGRPTTVKTRIMAQMGLRFPQQVARLDTLSRESISEHVERRIREIIHQHITQAEAVLLSDYHIGLLTPSLVQTIRHLAQQHEVLLTADAQGHFDKYSGFTLVKCNADEARSYLRRNLQTHQEFANAAIEICRTLKLTGGMVITRGADGATLALRDGPAIHCPAPVVTDVYDTVGAGDTAIAVLTLAAAAKIPYPEGVTLANYASGIVVRRVGNYTPSLEELTLAVQDKL
ncbi:MAG: bifunctional ADP-heptose synthase [Anaerolineae bacterium]|jgi:rfaE bifunctional protein kinase chain/domain|nr:bifunctional ADP-heptose synthase [Anaerolineae bacterium]